MEEAPLAPYLMRLLKLNTIPTQHLRTEKHFEPTIVGEAKKSQYCNFICNPLFLPSSQVKALQGTENK